jgi:adenylyltransferase/sulfurtransferase
VVARAFRATRVKYRQLPLKADRRAADQRLAGGHAGGIDRLAGAGKPLISGAAIRLEGQLSVFDPRRAESPCYHCLYGHGSDAELTCSEAGVIGPLVGLVGSLQALEALKLLASFGEPLVGRLLLIDALTTRFRELRVKRDPGCSVCGPRHG